MHTSRYSTSCATNRPCPITNSAALDACFLMTCILMHCLKYVSTLLISKAFLDCMSRLSQSAFER